MPAGAMAASRQRQASGWCFAHLIARDEPHPAATEFRLDRYAKGTVLDERGAGPQPNLH